MTRPNFKGMVHLLNLGGRLVPGEYDALVAALTDVLGLVARQHDGPHDEYRSGYANGYEMALDDVRDAISDHIEVS